MSPTKTILFLTLSIFFSSCSSGPKVKEQTGVFGENWKLLTQEDSSATYTNSKTGSIISKQSFCGQQKDMNSQELHKSLLKKLALVEMIFREENEVNKIITVRSHFQGVINENLSFLAITTYRDHRCVYDVSLISQRKERFEDDLEVYNDFLEFELNQFK
ncbi:MAG: hypothetical protein OHK0056_15190 [Bacteriovoracaceae bacterium]